MTTNTSQSARPNGRRILPRQAVTVLDDPVYIGARNPTSEDVGVELIRDGQLVREIHVRCPCGQTIVLECNYANEAAAE